MTFKNLFLKRQESIITAAALIGLTLLGSGLLGFIRDRLAANFFGDSTPLGLFYLADKLPNFIFSVLVIGGFSTAVIPVFTKYLKNDVATAWELSSQILSVVLVGFAGLGVILFIFATPIASLLTSSKLSPSDFATLVTLLRILLLGQLLLIVSNFLTCLLQSHKHFLIPALSPIFYNLGLIVGIVAASRFGIIAAAWGAVLGACMHLAIQIPALKQIDFKFKPQINLRAPAFLETMHLLGPRTLTIIVSQLSILIDSWLAAWVSVAAIVPYTFALHLQNVPLGIFGVSISAALFPTLSQKALIEDKTEFKKTFLTSFLQLSFLILPAAAVLLVLRVPAIRLVFGASRFSWEATLTAAYTLAFLALALFPQAAALSITKAFYALKDSKTPFIINCAGTIINIIVAILFIRVFHLGVWGLSLAYFISSSIECILLFTYLAKTLNGFSIVDFGKPFIKICAATFIMAGCLYLPLKQLDLYALDTSRTINLVILTAIAGLAGVISYLILTWLFKVQEIRLLYSLVNKIIKKPATAPEIPNYETTTNP
ncbi:MAG: murein biosynthesis integral membrane protein MurJ [candidate division WWE3 bacterium]|nr:murein biosynthesis integral membrane protein MurJ [candidate division WWE3 bacterium]